MTSPVPDPEALWVLTLSTDDGAEFDGPPMTARDALLVLAAGGVKVRPA